MHNAIDVFTVLMICAGYDTSKMQILESLGLHSRVAKIHEENDALLKASTSYGAAGEFDKAEQCIVIDLLRKFPIGTSLQTTGASSKSLLRNIIRSWSTLRRSPEAERPNIIWAYAMLLDGNNTLDAVHARLSTASKAETLILLDAYLQIKPDYQTFDLGALSGHVKLILQ